MKKGVNTIDQITEKVKFVDPYPELEIRFICTHM